MAVYVVYAFVYKMCCNTPYSHQIQVASVFLVFARRPLISFFYIIITLRNIIYIVGESFTSHHYYCQDLLIIYDNRWSNRELFLCLFNTFGFAVYVCVVVVVCILRCVCLHNAILDMLGVCVIYMYVYIVLRLPHPPTRLIALILLLFIQYKIGRQ